MLTRSGIYGANTPRWSERLWRLIGLGCFDWAVVRTDTDPQVARRLRDIGIEVIMQMPDGFNQNQHQSPAAWAERCRNVARPFREFSHIICLDNEPNLCQGGASSWFAEQFCRWYRAVLAIWRFHDPGGHWKVLFPALSPTAHLLPGVWLNVNLENLRESDALAAHSYWPGTFPPDDVHLDTLYRLMRVKASTRDIYILEYGSPLRDVGSIDKANAYRWFVASLPHYVKCACMFILGGTEEWRDWFLTEDVARLLGEE